MTSHYTPDGRSVPQCIGAGRSRMMFRWLMRAVTGHPSPRRGTVNSRTGRVTFRGNWKGGRHAK